MPVPLHLTPAEQVSCAERRDGQATPAPFAQTVGSFFLAVLKQPDSLEDMVATVFASVFSLKSVPEMRAADARRRYSHRVLDLFAGGLDVSAGATLNACMATERWRLFSVGTDSELELKVRRTT